MHYYYVRVHIFKLKKKRFIAKTEEEKNLVNIYVHLSDVVFYNSSHSFCGDIIQDS